MCFLSGTFYVRRDGSVDPRLAKLFFLYQKLHNRYGDYFKNPDIRIPSLNKQYIRGSFVTGTWGAFVKSKPTKNPSLMTCSEKRRGRVET